MKTSKPKYINFDIKSDSRISRRRKTHSRSHNKEPRIIPRWSLKEVRLLETAFRLGNVTYWLTFAVPVIHGLSKPAHPSGRNDYRFCLLLFRPK